MEEDLVVVDDSDGEQRSDDGGARLAVNDAPGRAVADPQRPVGKTPYTVTMKMRRGQRGYGFSVTWTQPPR